MSAETPQDSSWLAPSDLASPADPALTPSGMPSASPEVTDVLPADTGPLYPEVEPFAVGRLPVANGHVLHFEQCGNPFGVPVLFLHGGPGSRIRPRDRRYFDPEFYRIVLFDQRGCGQSTPLGATAGNTIRHLVHDIEALRNHLEFERVMLFGGSWGSTLALAYAIARPERVSGMVLRGIFLASSVEIDWYLYGLQRFVPEAWDAFAQGVSKDLLQRYHGLVNQSDERLAAAAAQRWLAYEDAVMALGSETRSSSPAPEPAAALARARVQLHYLKHDCFLDPGELAWGARRLAVVPVLIVQGRLDMVCPPRAALELAQLLPWGELRLVERGGHSAAEPAIAEALRRATDDMRARL